MNLKSTGLLLCYFFVVDTAVDPGSYTWESVSNLQNDLGIDVFTDFLDV